jgi:hypothetical protein
MQKRIDSGRDGYEAYLALVARVDAKIAAWADANIKGKKNITSIGDTSNGSI